PARLHLVETQVGPTSIEEVRLGVGVRAEARPLSAHATVRLVEIEASVAVEVEEPGAEAREGLAPRAEPEAGGAIAEGGALVEVEGVGLVHEIRHDDVEATVAVEVLARDPHAGLVDAVLVDRTARQHADVDEAARSVVPPQEVRHA